MTRFLANIMEMTRLETGEVAPRLQAVTLADLIELSVQRVPGLGHVGVNVAQDTPDVLADPALLEQVLVNVLENAAKYGPPHGLVRVTAGLTPPIRSGGNAVRVAVADEGPGISAEDLPQIFDSFYRASREDRTVPGTGLGLAIARGLIESMGGTITARSPRPDAPRDGAPGTLIEMTLPAARPKQALIA